MPRPRRKNRDRLPGITRLQWAFLTGQWEDTPAAWDALSQADAFEYLSWDDAGVCHRRGELTIDEARAVMIAADELDPEGTP